LASRLPWAAIEASVAPLLARQERAAKRVISQDLLGIAEQEYGAGISAAGRPPPPRTRPAHARACEPDSPLQAP
jgi:IS5 family transposase